MAKWTAFPYDADAYTYDTAALKKKWARLHAGDAEPLPKDESVLAAWALFHAGEFQKATEAGLKAHAAGAAPASRSPTRRSRSTPTISRTARRPSSPCSTRWPSAPRRSAKEDPKNANA